jgi:hypothetical protein
VVTVLAELSGMEREYILDRTLEGHESARARGKAIGGAAVTDDAMLAVAPHLRGQELSLRDIAVRPRHRHGKEEGPAPVPGDRAAHAARARRQAEASSRRAADGPVPRRLVVVLVGGVGVAQVADGSRGQVGSTKL